MCDTFVATGDITASGNVIFGKNSDREPNEAQAIERVPPREHDLTRVPELQATYISVPQVRESYEALLSRPFQMWGAEMGANQFGLAIGNEALFTRVPMRRRGNEGLTGMDLVRLALERCRTAEQALELITDMIARYSQNACGGYTDRSFYYHNGFILADPGGAIVLETAGEHWAAERVKGFRSISNGITIESEYDFSSPRLIEHAREQGWLRPGRDFSFRACYAAPFMTYFSRSRYRQARSARLGAACGAALSVSQAMNILRDHGLQSPDPRPNALQQIGDRPGPAVTASGFRGDRASMRSLCVHASGLLAPSQTTASMVAELRVSKGDGPLRPSTIWLTGTAAPCLATFKPCFATGEKTTEHLTATDFSPPGARADDSLWWRHERVHRAALFDYPGVAEAGLAERDTLEQDFIRAEAALFADLDPAPGDRREVFQEFSRECFARADAALDAWSGRIRRGSSANLLRALRSPRYWWYRRRLNRAVGL